MREVEENRRDPLPLEEVGRIVDLLRESGVGEIRVRRGETEIVVKALPEAPAPAYSQSSPQQRAEAWAV